MRWFKFFRNRQHTKYHAKQDGYRRSVRQLRLESLENKILMTAANPLPTAGLVGGQPIVTTSPLPPSLEAVAPVRSAESLYPDTASSMAMETAPATSAVNTTVVLGALTSCPSKIDRPNDISLIVDVASPGTATIESVCFYRESNDLVGLQTGVEGDVLVGVDQDASDSWGLRLSSRNLVNGEHLFYAVATDSTGGKSNVVSSPASVLGPGGCDGLLPMDADYCESSAYLIGSVHVTVVLFESDGTIDPDLTNWTTDAITERKREITQGLQWFSDTLPLYSSVHNVTFDVDFTSADTPFRTGYDPRWRPYSAQYTFIQDFLTAQGYSSSSNVADNARRFNHDNRVAHGADWAFTIFCLPEGFGNQGAFPGIPYAPCEAIVGGPWVLHARNKLWGDDVAHETAHVFGALDEYPGSSSYFQRSGYYNTQNLNAVVDNPNLASVVSSLMGTQITNNPYRSHLLSPSAAAMLGWQDSNHNGVFDVVDVPLRLSGSGQFMDNSFEFHGTASAVAMPEQHPNSLYTHDITLNTIDRIQYRIDGAAWQTSQTYSSYTANVSIALPLPNTGSHVIELRAFDDESQVSSATLTFVRPSLTVVLDRASISENGGIATAKITRKGGPGGDLIVNVASSDPTELTVPPQITIPAGQSMSAFPVTAVDDRSLDGTQCVVITVTTGGYPEATSRVDVLDYETLAITLDRPFLKEKDPNRAIAWISRSNTDDVLSQLDVWLSSSDPGEAAIQSYVQLAPGSREGGVYVTAVADNVPDEPQTVTICASANGYLDGVATIDILDEAASSNDAPTGLSLSPSTVAEGQPAGTIVGTFTTVDPDVSNTFSYSLVSGAGGEDNAQFTIGGPQLKTASVFDYEAKVSYNIRVRVTDQGGLSYEKPLTITVGNANDAPTGLSLSPSTVAEGQPAGTIVGTFTTVDPDVSNTFSYSLVSGAGGEDNAQFTIGGPQLKTASVFDYEAKVSYNIRVRVTDQGGLSYEKPLTITVGNANDAPTGLSLSPSTVAEGQPAGTIVGTFTTVDPDVSNTFSYSLVSGAGGEDNAQFTIGGPQLKTASVFDYEAKVSYNIRVRVTDQGGLSYEKPLTITVGNANDAPTGLSLSPSTVAEGQPAGTIVGTFTTVDPDVSNTFSYSLVSGAGGEDNAQFTIGGPQLKTASVFDYEAKVSYNIRVRVTDQGGLSYEKPLTITVGNANDAPTGLSLSPSTVAEGQPAGTIVGTFTTVDPDVSNTFSYSLVSGAGGEDNAQFTIGGPQLKTASVFDYEAKVSYNIRVRVTDQGGLSYEKPLTITVGNANDAPVLASIGDKRVDEQATLIFTTEATDQDSPTQNLTYSLDAASIALGMSLNPTTGVFTWTPAQGQLGRHSAKVTVTDDGTNPDNLTDSETITITVGGVVDLRSRKGGYSVLLRLAAKDPSKLELIDASNLKQHYWTAPAKSVFSLTIRGMENAADMLTVDYTNGPLLIEDGVVFDAKGGKPVDTLAIKNSAKGVITDDTVAIDTDRVDFNGTPYILQGVEDVSVSTGAGSDTIIVSGSEADLTLIDSAGLELLDFSRATNALTLNLATTSSQNIFSGNRHTLTLRGTFENAIGSPYADLIKGNSAANAIWGGDGNDTLNGKAGNDTLFGEAGDDWLYGEAGNDSIYGGSGNNVLLAGDGNDQLDVNFGGEMAPLGRNLLIGGKGLDTLYGGPGEDILIGGTTAYDSQAAALAAVMQAWTSDKTFGERCDLLERGFKDIAAGWIQLNRKDRQNPKGTVLDDGVKDLLYEGFGRHCLFEFATDDVRDHTAPGDCC